MSDEEWETLRTLARQTGLSASAYARQSILGKGQKQEQTVIGTDRENDKAPRTEAVFVRITEEEKMQLEEQAGWFGCSVPALVRRMLFANGGIPPVVIDTSQLKKTYLELHRQGVNLNQLMLYLNTYKNNADAREAEGVLRKVEAQLDALDAVLKEIQTQRQKAANRKKSG